jgi:hypothetical protein
MPANHPEPRGFTLVESAILTAILGLLVAVAVPNFIKSRQDAQCQLCIHNLTRIDTAKVEWAISVGLGPSSEPLADELVSFFGNQQFPNCPAGGEYDLGRVNEPTLCSLVDFGHYSEEGLNAYESDPESGPGSSPKPKKPKPGRRPRP